MACFHAGRSPTARPAFNAWSTAFDVAEHTNLENKYAVVTGGNSGIGKETVAALYRAGANVILCCRAESKGKRAAEDITKANPSQTKASITVQKLDLNDLESVIQAVNGIKTTLHGAPLDILVLNAGVIAKTLARTPQGFEEGWGVNFVGHYVLTQKLLSATTERTHIVAVSSVAHWVAKQIEDDVNFEHGRKFSGWQSYGQSKLAAILYMKYLARNPSIFQGKAYSVHPGAIATPLQADTTYVKFMFKLFSWWTKTPEQGAATSVYAATDLCDAPNGSYLKDCSPAGVMLAKQGNNAANGDKMVALVEASLKKKFPRYFEKEAVVVSGMERPPVQVSRKHTRASTATTGTVATPVASVTTDASSTMVEKARRATTLAESHTGESDGAERKDSIPAVY